MTSRFISCNAIRNHVVKITVLPWDVIHNRMHGTMQLRLNESCKMSFYTFLGVVQNPYLTSLVLKIFIPTTAVNFIGSCLYRLALLSKVDFGLCLSYLIYAYLKFNQLQVQKLTVKLTFIPYLRMPLYFFFNFYKGEGCSIF